MESYQKVSDLGVGSFGKVSLFNRIYSGEEVVIKEIAINTNDEDQLKKKQNEVLVLAKLNHPNIIQYYDSFMCNGMLNIVMEYATCGTLHTFLNEQKHFLTQRNILFLFTQILLALDHMHSYNILHRDLKSENIMLTGSQGNLIKLTDFGISKILLSSETTTQTTIGTPNYISPEVCNGIPYGSKSDIWALGCILFELCELRRLFDGPVAAVMTAITHGLLQSINLDIYDQKLQELMTIMCNVNPEIRPTTTLLLAHRLIVPVIFKIMCNLGSIRTEEGHDLYN